MLVIAAVNKQVSKLNELERDCWTTYSAAPNSTTS